MGEMGAVGGEIQYLMIAAMAATRVGGAASIVVACSHMAPQKARGSASPTESSAAWKRLGSEASDAASAKSLRMRDGGLGT